MLQNNFKGGFIMNIIDFSSLVGKKPQAFSRINGSAEFRDINGIVQFYQTSTGVLVATKVSGLPKNKDFCKQPIFAFHIHSGSSCTGNETDYFKNVLTHYNPNNCPHPYHKGDMPPLFGVNGLAFSVFLTDRFSINEIIGKTIVIHENPDDFTTQPAGNSGKKIACGEIVRY